MGRRGLSKRRKGLYIYTSFSAFSNTHALRQRPSLRKIPHPVKCTGCVRQAPCGFGRRKRQNPQGKRGIQKRLRTFVCRAFLRGEKTMLSSRRRRVASRGRLPKTGTGMLRRLYTMRRNAALLFAALCVAAGYRTLPQETAAGHILQEGFPAVILDAGHGGFDGGAVSSGQVLEKELNLSVAKKLELLLLSQGIEVIMTRSDDEALTLDGQTGKSADLRARAKIAQDNPDALLISIHMNQFGIAKYSGSQVFYSANNPDSKLLAEDIQQQIRQALQPENTRQIKQAGGEIYLLVQAQQPAVLVECGFLSNPEELEKLQEESYQQALAQAIASGLQNYYNRGEEQEMQAADHAAGQESANE